MQELATEAGLSDLMVVNTCAVTSEAVCKSRREIRRLQRENPTSKIVMTGCAAQIDPQSFASMEGVSAVLGNSEKMQSEVWQSLGADFIGEAEKIRVDDIMSVRDTAGHLIDGFGTRAPMCKCKMAAIIAVRFVLSLMSAEIRALWPQVLWSIR